MQEISNGVSHQRSFIHALASLPFLFTVTAVMEAFYAVVGLLTPPSLVQAVTGWVLNADGQWLAKLMGAALGFQAVVAWQFRKTPHLGLAKAFAGYQLLAATVDWILWVLYADQGIFSTPLAQITVTTAIITHYLLGILLVVAIRRTSAVATTSNN